MSNKTVIKPLVIALSTALVSSVAGASVANADVNPFGMTQLSSGYMVADSHEMKCGEGKCGGDKVKKEGKCGEGKCGGDKVKKEGKCGEGKCGGDKVKKEGKCGEGKCGGDKTKKEGKCGEGKCGGSK